MHLVQAVVQVVEAIYPPQTIGSRQGRTALRDQTHRGHWLLRMRISSQPKLVAAAGQSRAGIHTTGTLTPRRMLCEPRCQTSLGALISIKACVGRLV